MQQKSHVINDIIYSQQAILACLVTWRRRHDTPINSQCSVNSKQNRPLLSAAKKAADLGIKPVNLMHCGMLTTYEMLHGNAIASLMAAYSNKLPAERRI